MEMDVRERLDSAVLRSLGARRAYRQHRAHPSLVWDRLEAAVANAATVLWELETHPSAEDLLSFCAFVARELEVTESLDLDAREEWKRLQGFAPGAIATLDEISLSLADASADAHPVSRALAASFGRLRAELATASHTAWPTAA
jgi:hypothetical protein